jgi:hypothetical protein
MPEANVSGFLIRTEFQCALDAVVEFFKSGKSSVPTKVAGKYGVDYMADLLQADEDAMEVDEEALLPYFRNPFLDLDPSFVSSQGGFILTGHPGIGEQHIFDQG